MNKKILMVVGAIVVIAVGLYGSYRVYKHFKRLSTPTSVVQTETSNTPETATSSLRDLIAKGISESCTYSTDKSQGTIYMTPGKIRGDFNMTAEGANGQTTVSHMIIMDNTNYLWTEGGSTGIKMAFDQNATPAPVTANTATNSFDANALNNYKCSAWVVDSTKFDLPAGVTFRAFSMPVTTGTSAPSTGSNSSQCSYCNSLSGDSKAQCLTALKCN